MAMFVRNKTSGPAVDVGLDDLGITIEVGVDLDLSLEPAHQIRDSADLTTAITAGDLVLLDPADDSTELSTADSLSTVDAQGTPMGIAGADPDAIHSTVDGEIAGVTEKTTPVGADLLLIEDSAASNAKKRVQITNLPGGGGDVDPAAFVDKVWDFLAVENLYDTGSHINLDGWTFDIAQANMQFNELTSADADHPGVVQIEATGTGIVLMLSLTKTSAQFGDWTDITWIAKFEDRATIAETLNIQLAINPSAGDDNQEQLSFRSTALSADVDTVSADGTSFTRKTTGLTIDNNVWYNFRIKRNGANWEFYIDGTLVNTHTPSDDLPADSARANLGIGISPIIGSGQKVNLDFVRARLETNRASQ